MVAVQLYATFFVLLLTTAAMTSSLVYYGTQKHRAALLLSLCMAGLLSFAIGYFGIQIHDILPVAERPPVGVSLLIWSALGDTLLVYGLPLFLLTAFGVKPGRALRVLLFVLLTLTSAFAVLRCVTAWNDLAGSPSFVETALSVLLFGVVGVGFGLTIIFRSRLPSTSLYRSVVVQLSVLLLLLPAVILENAGVAVFTAFPGLGFVVSLAVASISAILHSIASFRRPKYVVGGEISPYFVERFDISKRELEVVSGLLEGLSNREIGDKLYISTRTVENHLYNIYQKTGISNRLQLFNLLRSDSL